ncbi:hypothetical protein PR048_009987 [Dryococelus australis]|uniref:Uncharacterized protein n=1 Tax=Dryococelus australis TaxID=614101 RepID=A0ABQ9I1F6_9NEOP|nr:hypothetical protein PR048_009987 [Dryococelus australis]
MAHMCVCLFKSTTNRVAILFNTRYAFTRFNTSNHFHIKKAATVEVLHHNNISQKILTSQHTYSEFKFSFGLPRSDTCSTCDAYYVKLCAAESEEDNQRILNETTIHHMKAALGYGQLQQDTEAAKFSPNLVVLCTDLQKVLFHPTLHHSRVFYQRHI